MSTLSSVRDRGMSLAEYRAFGPLSVLLDDHDLRDVMVQVGPAGGQVWLDRGRGVEPVPRLSPSPTQVRDLAAGLISAGGRHIDELHPTANVRLGAGVRVHAVLAPIVRDGAAISIRFPATSRPSFHDMVERGLCPHPITQVLTRAVGRKYNLLITGATGSGKTTLLAALLDLVPAQERIISIEDVQELTLNHPHHVALEARQANTEGAGEVTLEQLLKETLRMRPDRIVVGECRGAEVATLLAALNTGHDGGAGTMHANSVHDVPARLETLGMLGGLDPQTLARQAASALHLIVHLERYGGSHRITQVARLKLGHDGLLNLTTLEPT